MIRLKGFTPDVPTVTPGILLDCTHFIPYEAGMKAAPSLTAKADALAAACRGAEALTQLSGSRRVFAGTNAGLYELSGTSWTDRSRGGAYSLGSQTEWSFTQFGDTSIAGNLDNVIQSSASGAFANVATSPQAKIVESVLSSGGGFVFAFNTVDGTYGTSPDRWWCCALNDPTTWTPSVASQATTGRLVGGSGPITAAKQLGSDRIVAYKDKSIYVGTYVGPPTVWAWTEIPILGCAGINSVADMGTAHFVVGQDDLYIFDGARPAPIADNALRTWFFENSSGTYRYKTKVVFDRSTDTIWVFFPEAASSTGDCNRVLVYHVKTGQWGKSNRDVQQAFLFNVPGETFDSVSGTFNSDSGSFDQVAPGNQVVAVFNTSHVLSTLDGAPENCDFTLHDIGDDDVVTSLTLATLQYMSSPTSALLSAFGSMATGLTVNSGDIQNAYDVPAVGLNRFPLRQTARWHRLKFSFTGPVKVTGYNVPLKTAGVR